MASPTAKVRQDGTLGDIRVGLDVLKSLLRKKYFYNYHVHLDGDAVYELAMAVVDQRQPIQHPPAMLRSLLARLTGSPRATWRFDGLEAFNEYDEFAFINSMAALLPQVIYTTFTFTLASPTSSSARVIPLLQRPCYGRLRARTCLSSSAGRPTFKAASGEFKRRQPASAPSEAGLLRKKRKPRDAGLVLER